MQQMTIGDEASAVVLKVEHITGTENHVSIKVLPSVCRLYLTAREHEPHVELSQTKDHSGRQFWNATRTDFPSETAEPVSDARPHGG